MLMVGILLFTNAVMAESSESTSFRMDYGRLTNDADQSSSNSFQMEDAVSDISVEGESDTFIMHNVYAEATVVLPVCGNGVIEVGEDCDDPDYGGLTCGDYGFDSGGLQCVGCSIVTDACFNNDDNGGGNGGNIQPPVCGNGIKEAGEACDDGNQVNGDSCDQFCDLEVEPEPLPEPEEEEIPEDESEENVESIPDEIETKDQLSISGDFFELDKPEINPNYDPASEFPFQAKVEAKPILKKGNITDEQQLNIKDEEGKNQPIEDGQSDTDHTISETEISQHQSPIVILDETLFVTAQLEPQKHYQLMIQDLDGTIRVEQPVTTDRNGFLITESFTVLEYGDYVLQLQDPEKNVLKQWAIRLEDHEYRIHESYDLNQVVHREIIDLGDLEKNARLSGKGKLNSQYHIFIQQESNHGHPEEVIYLKTNAIKNGDFNFTLPDELKSGHYQMNVVQVYKDGKISRNLRYEFSTPSNPIWILIGLISIVLLTALFSYFYEKK